MKDSQYEQSDDLIEKNDFSIKHLSEKNKNIEKIIEKTFKKMKFSLDCNINIMIYGVGSKYNLLNLFYTRHLINNNCFIYNGFYHGCTIKLIISDIIRYISEDIYKN